ncbi:MAG: carbohydrate ABC transporter permease [Planctomycetes bacterium]|nr:carbohydrate ABC transporter permease [Planctomycetota bacterium]
MKRSALRISFLSILATIMFGPLLWLFVSSLKTSDEIREKPFALPETPRFENYSNAFEQGNFDRYVFNSVLVTGASVLGLIVVSSLAAFALSRLEFRGKNFLLLLFLVGMVIPTQTYLLPLFHELRIIGLFDTYFALILPYIAFELPFAIYIMHAFFLSLPKDLEDSARIDGCSTLGIYFHIMLPLIKPAIATVIIVTSLSFWNEFLLASWYINDEDLATLPRALSSFATRRHGVDYSLLLAGVSILTLPMLVLYLVFQRHIISGLTAGAVKG